MDGTTPSRQSPRFSPTPDSLSPPSLYSKTSSQSTSATASPKKDDIFPASSRVLTAINSAGGPTYTPFDQEARLKLGKLGRPLQLPPAIASSPKPKDSNSSFGPPTESTLCNLRGLYHSTTLSGDPKCSVGMTNRSKSLPSTPPAESFKPPQPPKLSHVIPLSNFKEEPQELPALEDHQAFKRSQVMKLVKTQINPSMRYIRSKQARMSEGPFVVAQNVSGEVYDEFKRLANVPYMTFTYDYPTRKILYYGDPTLVHEAFNFQFLKMFMGDCEDRLSMPPRHTDPYPTWTIATSWRTRGQARDLGGGVLERGDGEEGDYHG